ncbi:MAG TPA: nuclear transport factor 2 family protein [Chitinophagaceae bacterium]|nr:nuclear transport factor 2 family protein [Chitinophagaceae bacterium]
MKYLILLFLLGLNISAKSQTSDTAVLATNFKVDASVVEKNILLMKEIYADDFVFTHGGGNRVDSKASWIKLIENPDLHFISRTQDSTKVEMHGDVAIVIGKLDIVLERKQNISKYNLWYVRVFVLKENRWQIISHHTIKEVN